MPELKPALQLSILASTLAVAACASHAEAPHAATGSADHAAHHPTHPLPATAGPGFTVADVRFMQDMIGHHAQAITMTELAPRRGASESVRRLARKIDISQRDEIELMTRWLTERNQAVPDEAHAHTMPGMLTDRQLAQLEAARGREFDRLFLSFMVQHHQGALQMVETLFRSPGAGQDPDIFRFASDVDADQRDEILVMERLLERVRN